MTGYAKIQQAIARHLLFDYLLGDSEAYLKIVWLSSDLADIAEVENNIPPQGLTAATVRDDMWLLNQLRVRSPADAAFARVMVVYNDPSFSLFINAAWVDSLDFRVTIPEPSTTVVFLIGVVSMLGMHLRCKSS